MKLFTCLYGYIRFLIVIIQNIYVIPGYLVINWLFLLPLRLIKPSLFHIIENNLYSWTLYVVSSWSWLAGIQRKCTFFIVYLFIGIFDDRVDAIFFP